MTFFRCLISFICLHYYCLKMHCLSLVNIFLTITIFNCLQNYKHDIQVIWKNSPFSFSKPFQASKIMARFPSPSDYSSFTVQLSSQGFPRQIYFIVVKRKMPKSARITIIKEFQLYFCCYKLCGLGLPNIFLWAYVFLLLK